MSDPFLNSKLPQVQVKYSLHTLLSVRKVWTGIYVIKVQNGTSERWLLTERTNTSFNEIEHRFLTWGPWRRSRGSVKTTKVKYFTLLNLFYRYSGVHSSTL